MKTKTLTEAAAEMLAKSVAAGHKDAPERLDGEVEDLGGDTQTKVADKNPDATKGVKKATPPGKTPPVGSEPGQKLKEGIKCVTVEDDDDKDDDDSGKDGKKDFFAKKSKDKDDDGEDDKDDDDYEDKDGDGEDDDEEAAEKKKFKVEEALRVELRKQIEEDLGALFESDDLPDGFKKKAYAIFEAAVITRSSKLLEIMEEKYAEALDEAVNEIKDELTENTDKYLSHVVEEWVGENQIAIESGLRSELTEEFMTGLRNLFIEHNIDVPENKVDIVEEMAKEIAEKDEVLNAQMKKNIDLVEQLSAHQRKNIVAEACDGLTDVQKAKLLPLTESIEFTTEEGFKQQVSLMVENYAPANSVKKTSGGITTLEEGIEEGDKTPTSTDPTVNAFLKALNRTITK